MSLGIYPASRIQPPVRYAFEPVDSIRFMPLRGTDPVTGAEFLASDPMAERYGALGASEGRCLTLRDAAGNILSLPPILNSRGAGGAQPKDRELLLEATGTRPRAVREGLGLLLVVFAARGWSVAPVPVERADGSRDEGNSVVEPVELDLSAELLEQITGYSPDVPRGLGGVRPGASHRPSRAGRIPRSRPPVASRPSRGGRPGRRGRSDAGRAVRGRDRAPHADPWATPRADGVPPPDRHPAPRAGVRAAAHAAPRLGRERRHGSRGALRYGSRTPFRRSSHTCATASSCRTWTSSPTTHGAATPSGSGKWRPSWCANRARSPAPRPAITPG